LVGKRLACLSETKESQYFDAASLKELTGGGSITARALYSNEYNVFNPTYLLLLIANHLPTIPQIDDPALWQRLCIVQLTERFIDTPNANNIHEHPSDNLLREKLSTEHAGILAWLVRGCVRWYRRPNQTIPIPSSVSQAATKYRDDQDIIGQFLTQFYTLTNNENDNVPAQELQNNFSEWSSQKISPSVVSKYLLSKGIQKGRNSKGQFYTGLQNK